RPVQPGRHAPGRCRRPGADRGRDRDPAAGGVHRRGDSAPRQGHPAQPRLLTPGAKLRPTPRHALRPPPPSGVTARDPARGRAGGLGVGAPARLVRHYRYAEERLMRTLAGWIALTPELPVKLLLGRQVWECAQHADLWGKRLPELRAPAQVSEPPNGDFVRFMDALGGRQAWGETLARLTGVSRVLKPHLVEAYARHLERTNPVYEPPTRAILERCLGDERRHVADGERVLAALADTDARQGRVAAWQAELARLLREAGGVAGILE